MLFRSPLRGEERQLRWILPLALCALAIQLSPPHEPLPPEGAHFRAAHHPDRSANPDLLPPARSRSGPSRPLKCRSTLPGTGRCWPTRISRSTCARWVSAARRALPGAPGRAAGGGIPAPSRAGRPPACLHRPSHRPEHPDRGRGISRGPASANWRTGVIRVHGGQCLMVGSRSG